MAWFDDCEHEMTPSQKLLSVIVPVRVDADRLDVVERLGFLRSDPSSQDVEVIVVDDGSLHGEAEALKRRCTELGYRYIPTACYNRVFSIGRARNVGVQAARTPFVMFQDADLIPCDGFYQGVLVEIEVQKLKEFAERFLMFGVIYLTEAATKEFFACEPLQRRSRFTQYLLDDDQEKIEKFSTGTSVIVVSRDYYLGCGGMDPDFEGWGFEDLEFTCRMLRRNRRFPLPAEFDRDYRNFRTIQEYRGWKSVYRLFGDITFSKGLVLFHAWHRVVPDSTYMNARSRNMRLFQAKLNAFRSDQQEPPPLPKPEKGRSLVFRTNPFVLNRWVVPSWGELVLVNESDFDAAELIDFIHKHNITRVVFHNPYANDRMSELYEAIRRASIEYVVCERGALPDATFFDPRGFNGASSSYDPVHWDRPLDEEEVRRTLNYIRLLVSGEASLEKQPEKAGAATTRRALGIKPGQKVLFVPFQRPTDTVMTRLANPIGSFAAFVELLQETSASLPPEWVIVAKRHPLEVDQPGLDVIWANESHVHDLLDVADAVLLVNSGVGVLALAHGKPVLVAGTALYGHPGLSVQVRSAADVMAALGRFRPDEEKVLRFIHYLVFEFYSFGKFQTREVAWTAGAKMTATVGIDYEVVRLPGQPSIRYERRSTVEVAEGSILFDRYRKPNGMLLRDEARGASPPPPPSAAKRVEGKAVPTNVPPGSARRKLKKLSEDPRAFFRDSRIPAFRSFGKLLD